MSINKHYALLLLLLLLLLLVNIFALCSVNTRVHGLSSQMEINVCQNMLVFFLL